MKICIFYGGYLPGEKYGGPVTSIYNFTELFGDDNNIFIVCSNHDLNDNKPYIGIKSGWNIVGKAKVLYLSESEFSKQKYIEIIDSIKPDILYVSSIFSARINYPLFSISKERKVPLLLAPRGELNNTALKRKKIKKSLYLMLLRISGKLKNVIFQATSEEERHNIIHNLGVNKEKVFLLPNIPSLPRPKLCLNKEKGSLKVCFVGRIVANKNLLFAIEAVQRSKCNVIFDIFGAKEDATYWKQCVAAIKQSPQNIQINYRGVLSPLKMNELYCNYDCLTSPTLFENYGQAIVESMLHDTPVIISEGTTPWNNIIDFNAGYVITLDKQSEFTKTIDNIGFMEKSEYYNLVNNLRVYCKETFKYDELIHEYNKAFSKIIGLI